MRRFIILITYLVYFVYGFLFSCGYIGGNALLNAIEAESGVLLIFTGLFLLILLFITSLFWIWEVFFSPSRKSDVILLSLLLVTPLLASIFFYYGGDGNQPGGFTKMLTMFFISILPLILCVFVARGEKEKSRSNTP